MDLPTLKKKLLEERGFDPHQYSDSFFKRRLATRLRAHAVSTYDDYALILKKDPDEYDKLWSALTINVTRFFRDAIVWEAIEKKMIPELISYKEARGEKCIRVWSAGCSTGEEAYSIAILLKPFAEEFTTFIYGTDRDARGLDRAKEGVYGVSSLGEIKPKHASYLEHSDGEYRIKDEIKRMVKFMKHDLLEDKYFKRIDLILCRNVLIYFKKEAQEQVVSNFCESLKEHGYMVLGRVETIFVEAKERFTPVDLGKRIYRKSEQH